VRSARNGPLALPSPPKRHGGIGEKSKGPDDQTRLMNVNVPMPDCGQRDCDQLAALGSTLAACPLCHLSYRGIETPRRVREQQLQDRRGRERDLITSHADRSAMIRPKIEDKLGRSKGPFRFQREFRSVESQRKSRTAMVSFHVYFPRCSPFRLFW
jgi:hypothetical protein